MEHANFGRSPNREKYGRDQGLASPRLNWDAPNGLRVGAPVPGVDELDGHNGSLGPQE